MNENLILFVERAYKLNSNSFWIWSISTQKQPDFEKIFSGDWLAHSNLNPEALDAFCLNLRLLIQDRDGFSVREILKLTKSWPIDFNDQKIEIEKAIKNLNIELNKKCVVQAYKNKTTTNEELFKIIFYGGIVHSRYYL